MNSDSHWFGSDFVLLKTSHVWATPFLDVEKVSRRFVAAGVGVDDAAVGLNVLDEPLLTRSSLDIRHSAMLTLWLLECNNFEKS